MLLPQRGAALRAASAVMLTSDVQAPNGGGPVFLELMLTHIVGQDWKLPSPLPARTALVPGFQDLFEES